MDDVDSEGLWVTRDGQRFPLREMSDGFRTVASLVVDLLKQIHDAFGDAAFPGDGEGLRGIRVPGVRFLPSRWRKPAPYRDTYSYSCAYAGGPTTRHIGGRPPRGEDSPLVRPYLVAEERRTVARRVLRIVGPSADIRTLPALRVGMTS